MMTRYTRALALTAMLASAACSGGGASSPKFPRPAGKTVATRLTIVIPLVKQASAARRAQFISPGTQSGGIALGELQRTIAQSFDLSSGSPNCTTGANARTCQVTADLPLGSDTINLYTFDGPLANGATSGHQLATCTVTQTIVEGQANTVTMSLLGLPASVTIAPQRSTISATGMPVTVPLTVSVFDASGNQITGTDPYAQPVVLSAQTVDPHNVGGQIRFSVNGAQSSSLTSPQDTVVLTYPGSSGTGSYTLTATIDFGNTRIGSAPFTIQPGFTLVRQIFSGGMANADMVQRSDTKDIWFTEPASHKVALLSASGTLAEYTSPSGKEPRHLAYTSANGVFAGTGKPIVMTEFPDTIGVVADNGTITETTVPTAGAGLGGIWFDVTTFKLWFAESAGKIGTADLTGHVTEIPTGIAGSAPAAVAKNFSSGNIWFTDPGTNAIGSLKLQDHSVVEYPIPTANAGPSVIASATSNDTWFAENNVPKLGHIDNSSGSIVEYAAPDVIVSIVSALSDGSGAALWALTRGGTVLKYDMAGKYVAYPITLAGNGTPVVMTQGYYNELLILRIGVSISDLDVMTY